MANPYFCTPKAGNGSVVQLVRMPPCHGGGRGFESRPVRKRSSAMMAFCIYPTHFSYFFCNHSKPLLYQLYPFLRSSPISAIDVFLPHHDRRREAFRFPNHKTWLARVAHFGQHFSPVLLHSKKSGEFQHAISL